MLYFGYGSNLCERDWGEWCSRNGEQADGLRFVRRAWLPEHELAFTFNSGVRGGGVLDVRVLPVGSAGWAVRGVPDGCQMQRCKYFHGEFHHIIIINNNY